MFYEMGRCWNLNAVGPQSSERHSTLRFVSAMPCRRISSPGRCLDPHRPLCHCLQGIQPRSCNRAGPFPSRYLLIKISVLTSRIGHSLSIFLKCIKIAKIVRTMYWLIAFLTCSHSKGSNVVFIWQIFYNCKLIFEIGDKLLANFW